MHEKYLMKRKIDEKKDVNEEKKVKIVKRRETRRE